MEWSRMAVASLFMAALPMLGQPTDGISTVTTLAALKDHARPLLIFAPEANDSRLVKQVSLLSEHSKDAAERDLLAVSVSKRGSYPAGYRLAEPDLAEARRRFHVAPEEFVVVLVGKDGGEKLRSDAPVAFEKLRDLIDAMPMRRDELKGKAR
jgi:hypothetical protein